MRIKISSGLTHLMVVGGILMSLGLIAVSATLNFRMAYRMADSELDGLIFGSGAALADGLKAMLAFFAWSAWRKGEWLAVTAGAVLFVVCSSYSLTAGIGYAAQLRAHSEAVRVSSAQARSAVMAEITRLEARQEQLGVQRSKQEISADIQTVYARVLGKTTVGKYSQNCTTGGNWSRHSCAEEAALQLELTRAEEAEKIGQRLTEMRAELSLLGASGAEGRSDPQLVALSNISKSAGWTTDQDSVRLSLLILVGSLFELGSSLGLYVATVPWRKSGPGEVGSSREIGAVEEFALERLEPRQGEGLSISALFGDYLRWAAGSGAAALAEADFRDRFRELATDCGLPTRRNRSQLFFPNVGLIETGTAATDRVAA
ncbi:hypothetical protein A7A08_02996 [Methyloligella halotolerans]|uniref:DUF4407 domain-containing protein n=1 Tax=Methyloligella halotolerans TaxID=1177755 RepID=A0A1E2RVA3_9HYPH|nr:hypothetical protein [Methyloligella halotolerans]ODA66143.1 hypothetical protein A7A08_02996 [Methyloligella halotolerans]